MPLWHNQRVLPGVAREGHDFRHAAQPFGGNRDIRFTGGEPCLRPELLVALSRRFLEGLPGSVVRINSNGTLVDDASWAVREVGPEELWGHRGPTMDAIEAGGGRS